MYAKIHTRRDGRTLLAVCDAALIDKVFEDGKKRLDLTTDFYKGEIRSKKEVADLLRNADMVNLVGEESIALAEQEELLKKDEVMRISGIPLFQSLITDEP